jgi:DNA-binding NarL/FixJ family response regulator
MAEPFARAQTYYAYAAEIMPDKTMLVFEMALRRRTLAKDPAALNWLPTRGAGIHQLRAYLNNHLAAPSLDRVQLTPRQTQIMGMVAAGFSASEIAKLLGTSSRTVEHHRSAAVESLGARSLPHAAVLFDRATRDAAA